MVKSNVMSFLQKKKKKPRLIDVSRLLLRFKFVHLVKQQVNLIKAALPQQQFYFSV
jgi:hypothetical protein